MTQDFDFFLLLSALTTYFGHLVDDTCCERLDQRKISHHLLQLKKFHRIAIVELNALLQEQKSPLRQTLKKSKSSRPKIATLYFTTQDDQPFAVIRLSTIGAQVWGNESIKLSISLTRFIDRFLPRDEGESLLIHLVSPLPSDTALYAQAYGEDGECVAKSHPVGLTPNDFPHYKNIDSHSLKDWIRQTLVTTYHTIFFTLSASEMALFVARLKKLKRLIIQD